MMEPSEFHNQTVVLTGAGGGLGRALGSLLHARGARIVGCDVSPASNLDDMPGVVAWHAFDLSSSDGPSEAAQSILDQHGCPDILINNAGWTRAETLAGLDDAKTATEIDTNLTGVMRFTDPLAKAMAARGSGSVVFVSSVNSLAHFGNPAYAAAKAGINAYARAVAVELGSKGVRANVVCPGSIRTHAWDHRIEKDPDVMGRLKKLYPLGRIVDAKEVAEAILFLASSRAAGITGTILPVDAGLTAGCLPFIEDILGG